MPENSELGNIICGRNFQLKNGDEVIVNFWQPIEYGEEFRCHYKIEGLGDNNLHFAIGFDSFQSILLAFKAVGTTLLLSDEYKSGRLLWQGDRDLEFPYFEHLVEGI